MIMDRNTYIDKLIILYKLKYNPSEVEVEEFRLLLENMPDYGTIKVTPNPNLVDFDTIAVAYGCPVPRSAPGFSTDANSYTGKK